MRRETGACDGAAEGPVRQRRHRVRRLALPGDQRRLRDHDRRVRGDQGAGHRPVRQAVQRGRVHASSPSTTATSGESGGQPRQVQRVREQLADWQAAIGFAATLPGVDPTRLAIWGFSASGGHVFRVAARNPELAAAIAQTPNADGLAASRNAARHQKPLAMLRFTGRGVARRRSAPWPAARRGWCRWPASREPSRCSPRRTPGTATGRSTRTTGTRTGSRRSPPVRRFASASTGPAGTRPGCGARCWCWSATRTSRRWPARRPRRRAGRRAASWSGCPAGTTSRSSAATSRPSRPSCPSCAGTCSRARPASRPPRRAVREAAGMKEIELSAGTIEYEDTGGDGPVARAAARADDGRLAVGRRDRRPVRRSPVRRADAAARARTATRCDADADLSLPGIARLVAEFLDRLDLRDVTLVGNDTGGALVQLLMGDGTAAGRPGRARLVRRVRQLPARPDRQDARARRQAPAARCSGCSCSRCGCGRCGGCRSRSAG